MPDKKLILVFICILCFIRYFNSDSHSKLPLGHESSSEKFSKLPTWILRDRLQAKCPHYSRQISRASVTELRSDWADLCWRQNRLAGSKLLPYDLEKLTSDQLCRFVKQRCINKVHVSDCPQSRIEKERLLEKCAYDFIPVTFFKANNLNSVKMRLVTKSKAAMLAAVYSCSPNPYLYDIWRKHNGRNKTFAILCPRDATGAVSEYPAADFTFENGASFGIDTMTNLKANGLSVEHLKTAEKVEAVLKLIDTAFFNWPVVLLVILVIPVATYAFMLCIMKGRHYSPSTGLSKLIRNFAFQWTVVVGAALLWDRYRSSTTALWQMGLANRIFPIDFLIWMNSDCYKIIVVYPMWVAVFALVAVFLGDQWVELVSWYTESRQLSTTRNVTDVSEDPPQIKRQLRQCSRQKVRDTQECATDRNASAREDNRPEEQPQATADPPRRTMADFMKDDIPDIAAKAREDNLQAKIARIQSLVRELSREDRYRFDDLLRTYGGDWAMAYDRLRREIELRETLIYAVVDEIHRCSRIRKTDAGIRCTICQMDIVQGDQTSIFECLHEYHTKCILVGARQHRQTTCPNCRAKLLDVDC